MPQTPFGMQQMLSAHEINLLTLSGKSPFRPRHQPMPVDPQLPIYFMHDQPTTCPMCGRRTEWLGEQPQLHDCPCGYQFLLEDGDVPHGL